MAEIAFLIVLKVLMLLICAGWVSLWILKPTQMWTKTWKGAEDTFRPTLLGQYGTTFIDTSLNEFVSQNHPVHVKNSCT